MLEKDVSLLMKTGFRIATNINQTNFVLMMKRFLTILSIVTVAFSGFSQEYGTGLLFDDAAYNEIPKKPNNVSFFDELANVKSASLKDYVPTVKNQGGYGTCLGWSMGYYGRTILEAKQQDIQNTNAIDEMAFSPIYTYLHAKVQDDNYNCAKGAYIHLGAQSLVENGSPLLKEYPEAEYCANEIPEYLSEAASRNKIQEYRGLLTENLPYLEKIENVKRALYNGNPVIGGFRVENALHIAKNVYIADGGPTPSGHAMCIVGFDDDRYGGAFEIVNSWGTNWGNNGYIWMKYEDFAKLCVYAVELIPVPKPVDEYKTLSADVRVELRGGTPMPLARGDAEFKKSILGWQDVIKDTPDDNFSLGDYKSGIVYPAGTSYKMRVNINKAAYVYVFGADSAGENNILFPYEDGISPYFDYQETELVLPGEEYSFRLNKEVASDYTILVFSLEKIDYKDVLNKLNQMEGELNDKLYMIFNEELISKDDINLDDNSIKFDARFQKGSVVSVVLDIRRS